MLADVLEESRRILGDKHPSGILAMNNLASTLRDQSLLDEAEQVLIEALNKRKETYSEEHRNTIAARDL